MYEFGILLFGGLVIAKAVDLLRHWVKDMDKRYVLVMATALGVGLAYLTDFSIFSAWGMSVRSATVGTIVTGFVMAGLAGAWHESLGLLREFAHRYHGEATEIEARLRRAA